MTAENTAPHKVASEARTIARRFPGAPNKRARPQTAAVITRLAERCIGSFGLMALSPLFPPLAEVFDDVLDGIKTVADFAPYDQPTDNDPQHDQANRGSHLTTLILLRPSQRQSTPS